MKKDNLLRVLVLSFFLAFSPALLAQQQADPCIRARSLYKEYLKQKHFDDALKFWQQAVDSCVLNIKGIYVDGAKIYHGLIPLTSDSVPQNVRIDSLCWIYDRRILFIGDEGYVRGRKGMDMMRFRPERPQEALEELTKSVQIQGIKSELSVLRYWLLALHKAYEKNLISRDRWLGELLQLGRLLDEMRLAPKTHPNSKFTDFYEKLQNYIADHFDCAELEEWIKERVAHPNHLPDVFSKGISQLKKAKCMKSELLHTLLDSALQQGQVEDPIAFLEAIKVAKGCDALIKVAEKMLDGSNAKQRELIHMKLADCHYQNANYPKTRFHAEKALAENPENGDAYMLIGNAYAASVYECATNNECEIRAVYWVAADMYLMALKVDPSVKMKAMERLTAVREQFPNKAECFMAEILEKETYIVKCWINRTTEVRF